MKAKNKKIIALAVCAGMLFSIVGTMLPALADSGLGKIKVPFTNKSFGELVADHEKANKDLADKLIATKSNQGTNEQRDKMQPISVDNSQKSEVLYKGTRYYPANVKPGAGDQFKLTQSDIDQLVKDGHSVSDILEADEYGNKNLIDPKRLLKMKKDENKSFAEIEKEVDSERDKKYLNILKGKYPKEHAQLVEKKLKDDDELKVLSFMSQNDVDSFDGLVKDYMANGEDGLKKHGKRKSVQVSKELMAKDGLTEDDVQGFSETMIKQFEIMSQKSNIPLKEIIKNMKQQLKELEAKR